MSAHTVAELRDAWRAIEAGKFTPGRRPTGPHRDGTPTWTPAPGERVIAVVGCAGGVGASTVALALATAIGVPARVVECCPPMASGFSAAANAELGIDGAWRRGSRGDVLLERRTTTDPTLPLPAKTTVEWTILDAPWTALADPTTWPAALLHTLADVVLVTDATVPGLRRLESCADLLERPGVGVVVGPPARRWPRPVKVAAAGLPTSLEVVDFPLDPRLQVTGLTPDPLPAPLVKAAEHLLTLLRKEPS